MKEELDPRKTGKEKKENVLNREVYYPDDIIIHQGDDGYRAYYIERGKVLVTINDDGHDLKIAELGPGDIFGEMALINQEPRSASVKAASETVVSVIARDEIEGRIQKVQDKAIRALIAVLCHRVQTTTQGQLMHYKDLADFQDRITGMVDRVDLGIDAARREQFREEVEPLLNNLQNVLDKYQK